MDINILGICGTFMGGIAVLAKQAGFNVKGCDQNVYPPMSTQLEEQGIKLTQGFEHDLDIENSKIIVGNAMSRGNPAVETMLNEYADYTSGPQWLAENILQDRWVLAVSGTHGKTTTASMLAWILEYAGQEPGFLIGGVPKNFGISARIGKSKYFVVEADEYDTAFFDKRSKFVHYRPTTLIINNLEFDHADIFEDLAAIQRQFHHVIRTVPGKGKVIYKGDEESIQAVLEQGCWSKKEAFALKNDNGWGAKNISHDGSEFEVCRDGKCVAKVAWQQQGMHNIENAIATIAAAEHIGISPETAAEALGAFTGVARRMDIRAQIDGVTVYDDFAHHPTAIKTTVDGLRRKVGKKRIIAVLEPRSNTMKMGINSGELADSLQHADLVFMHKPQGINWDIEQVCAEIGSHATLHESVETIVKEITWAAQQDDNILIMSNGAFEDIHNRIISELKNKTDIEKKES